MTLAALNALEPSDASAEFLRCCGSSRWAVAMTAARPFVGVDAMQARGERIWSALDRRDWLEAFAAHPKIGAQHNTSPWSAAEQSGMQSADAHATARLAALNAAFRSSGSDG